MIMMVLYNNDRISSSDFIPSSLYNRNYKKLSKMFQGENTERYKSRKKKMKENMKL
jgi:hypothetical protein